MKIRQTVTTIGLVLGAVSSHADELPSLDCVVNPNQVVDVASPVPGVLADIRVDRSDFVHRNTVVAQLAAGVERAGVELALARTRVDAEINAGRINVEYDLKRMDRLESLYGRQVISTESREEAEREASLSQWRLQQAEELKRVRALELERAKALLEQKTIRAPIDGVVVKRFKARGEHVDDHPIVRIAQLDPLRVEAIVPMSMFGEVRAGMKALVYPEVGSAREAEVEVVDPLGDAASATFGVRLTMQNPDYSVPAGSRCEMQFVPGSAPEVVGNPWRVVSDEPSTHHTPVVGDSSGPALVDVTQPDITTPDNAAQRPTTVLNQQTAPLTSETASVVPQESIEKEPIKRWRSIMLDPRSSEPTDTVPTTLVTAPVVETDHDDVDSAIPVNTASPDTVTRHAVATNGEPRTLGPFHKEEDVKLHQDRLHQAGIRFVTRVETKKNGEYMVLARTDDPEAVIVTLQMNGLDDYYLIKRPPHQSRLSLGVYSSPGYANMRVQQVEALGIETEVVTRSGEVRVTWLDVEDNGTPGSHEQIVQEPTSDKSLLVQQGF